MTQFAARVERDSISEKGKRLVTVVATYPRIVHSELMTHRAFERSAASSRAIPLSRMVEQVVKTPFVPIQWGAEQRGMQTGNCLPDAVGIFCEQDWLHARDWAVVQASRLNKRGLHKSICNRLLEPFGWITVVITATEWANFFRLRCHPDAEIHLQKIAEMIRDVIRKSTPSLLSKNEWHLPFTDQEDASRLDQDTLRRVSVARTARTSYLTHDGTRDVSKDLELFDKLVQGSGFGHWAPHGHAATPSMDPATQSGPLVGWYQYRKMFTNENAETPLNYVP